MWLKRIEIEGFRNISHAEVHPCNGYNLITGANGSGKSSILESIHCLSTGRSFRTNKKLPIIQLGSQQTTVFGEVETESAIYRAGIQKRRDGSSLLRLDGRNIESQIEVALILPVIGMTPEGEDLLSEGAKVRQAYLDWTLFHVEPSFRDLWRNYRRALYQRNRALKGYDEASLIRTWDNSLISDGLEVDRLRKMALSRLVPIVSEVAKRLLPSFNISFSFRQGWPKDQTFSQSLALSLEADRKMGYTHSGPHRADIVIKSEQGVPTQTFSRGQKKLLTAALKIAQALDYHQQTDNSPIFYIDDLPAELDPSNRKLLMKELLALKSQLFVTASSSADIDAAAPPGKLFHVEQGSVKDMV